MIEGEFDKLIRYKREIMNTSKTKNPVVLEDDDGIRPAGKPDECFYCKQKVGKPHNDDCVILVKRVIIEYTYTIEIEVPHHWDEEMIKFHRNESSWCADNGYNDIEEYLEKYNHGCSCSIMKAKVKSISTDPPYRKNDKGEIVI